MANTTLNGNPVSSHGQQKKTLAAQLDRLDSIIDALSDGLNETVADVVREAVSAAVQQTVEAVLREVLSRPELLRGMAPASAPASPAPVAQPVAPAASHGPSLPRRLWSWLWGKVTGLGTCLGEAAVLTVLTLGLLAALLYEKVTQGLGVAWTALRAAAGWVWRHPQAVALAAATGLVVGLGAYVAGPLVSSVAVGVAGSLTSLMSVLRLLGSTQTADSEE